LAGVVPVEARVVIRVEGRRDDDRRLDLSFLDRVPGTPDAELPLRG
jgi:hypothetical protein